MLYNLCIRFELAPKPRGWREDHLLVYGCTRLFDCHPIKTSKDWPANQMSVMSHLRFEWIKDTSVRKLRNTTSWLLSANQNPLCGHQPIVF